MLVLPTTNDLRGFPRLSCGHINLVARKRNPVTPLEQAVVDYQRFLKVVRRRAAGTVHQYVREAHNFTMWAAAHHGITKTQEITSDIMTAYVEGFSPTLSDNTFNLYLTMLRGFCKWLAAEERLGADSFPWRNLVGRDKPQPVRDKQFISRDAAYRLAEGGYDWHPRDKYYILASYWMARRWSEMSQFTVAHVDFTPRHKYPNGVFKFDNIKARKKNTVLPLRTELAEVLKEWMVLYAKLLGRPLQLDDMLFPALKVGKGSRSFSGLRMPLELNPKRPIPYGSALVILERAAKIAGMDKATTHGLRRGGLDDLIEETGDIRMGMIYADHSNQRTTEGYTNRDRGRDDLSEALTRLAAKEKGDVVPQAPEGVTSLTDFRARRRGSA